MNREESIAEANRILSDAGWKPGDQWDGKFVFRGTLIVGGIAPDGNGYVKNPEAVLEGHPLYGDPAYPDEPHEAAQWLVDHYGAKTKFRYRRKLAPVTIKREDVEGFEHGEAEGYSAGQVGADVGEGAGADQGDAATCAHDGSGVEALAGVAEDDPIDADFEDAIDLGAELLDDEAFAHSELPAPDPLDFAPDENKPDEPPGAFIFGDNLYQLRTAAIGLVVQAALNRLPAPTDYLKLSELRNFTMGVSENRWPDSPAMRAELDALEATERQRRAVEAARDEKVAFLVEANREQIEVFNPEADWP